MDVEANKALIRRYMEAVWSRGDLSFAQEALADEFIDYTAPPGVAADRAGHHQNVAAFRAAFPDAHFTLQDLVAEGDKVVVRWVMQAYHQGSFFWLTSNRKAMYFGRHRHLSSQRGQDRRRMAPGKSAWLVAPDQPPKYLI